MKNLLSRCKKIFYHKNSSAFTFVEVLLALVILATSMTLLSNLQSRSIFRVLDSREQVDRMFHIKRALYEFLLQPKKTRRPRVARIADPESKIISEMREINRKSSLYPLRKNIVLISSRGEWESGPKKKSMTMIGFLFKHEEKSAG